MALGYDGSTNQFVNPSGVPDELQKVIDQVMSYASKPVGGARGITAAQGRAMEGITGSLTGIAKEAADIAARERMAAEANKTHLETAKIGITPAMQEQETLSRVVPGSRNLSQTFGIGSRSTPILNTGTTAPDNSMNAIWGLIFPKGGR